MVTVELSEFEFEVIRRALLEASWFYDRNCSELLKAKYERHFSDVAEDAAICASSMWDLLHTKFRSNPEIRQVVPMTRGLYFRSH